MKILTQTDLLGFRLAPPIFFWLSFTGAYYIGAVSIHFPLATIVVSDTVLVFFFFFSKIQPESRQLFISTDDPEIFRIRVSIANMIVYY